MLLKLRLFTIVLMLLIATTVYADVDKANVSGSVNTLSGSTGWGLNAGTPYNAGPFSGEVSFFAQGGENIVRGKYHAEVGIPVGPVEAKVFADGDVRGKNLGDLGRKQDVGVGIEFAPISIGTSDITLEVGIFGSNAGPYGPTSARDVLEASGRFSQATLDKYNLGFNADPTGLSIKNGNSLNLLFLLNWEWRGIDFKARLSPEVFGNSDNKVHQIIITPSTALDIGKIGVGGNASVVISGDVGFQTFDGGWESDLSGTLALRLTR